MIMKTEYSKDFLNKIEKYPDAKKSPLKIVRQKTVHEVFQCAHTYSPYNDEVFCETLQLF